MLSCDVNRAVKMCLHMFVCLQGIEYLLKRIGVKRDQMELQGHRILATAACSLVSVVGSCRCSL